MKLSKAISSLVQGLQQVLFPELEEWWQGPLTEKEQELVSILELVQVETLFLAVHRPGGCLGSCFTVNR